MSSGSDTVHSNRSNAILGALLGTLLFVQTVRIIDESFSAPESSHAEASHKAETKEAAAASSAGDAESFNKALASASAERGAGLVKQCQSCHTIEEGQGKKVGPGLYGVVNRPIASEEGFNYSAALKSKAGGKWTFAELNKWLDDPKAYAKGTSMGFPGLKSETKRADLVAYLNTLSKSPAALPK
ncbi:cytochrome c [Nitrobacter vulgaris]|uniref:Cytochrome C n=1 Tax=Nitrobacter vulgaris TaxID=29421 RepID=A0A1V4HUX4_NITVU|nr:cytochrome c family protein [Nitrobacter vulgaris]MDR6305027.1 cytochrome c [Nitrobacter vulgaris]OPH81801.1 cytochrome C [Nitrobacter vulgaris]